MAQILDAIARIETYAAVGRERFFVETHWQDAVIRQLQIVGEATKRISPQLRNQHPDIEWRRVTGVRDVLIHNYDDVDLSIVWEASQVAIPDLKRKIEGILEAPPSQGA